MNRPTSFALLDIPLTPGPLPPFGGRGRVSFALLDIPLTPGPLPPFGGRGRVGSTSWLVGHS